VYVNSVRDFRALRRALPKADIFNLQYEDWQDEGKRLSVLGRLVEFIGAWILCEAIGCVVCVCVCVILLACVRACVFIGARFVGVSNENFPATTFLIHPNPIPPPTKHRPKPRGRPQGASPPPAVRLYPGRGGERGPARGAAAQDPGRHVGGHDGGGRVSPRVGLCAVGGAGPRGGVAGVRPPEWAGGGGV
jgi:hypothetical protein